MFLKQSFDSFLQNKVNLDESRKNRIKSAHSNLREYLSKHKELKSRYVETFLQGSYATQTAVKPSGDNEFDVDVVLAMNLKDRNGNYFPITNINGNLYGILNENSKYNGKLIIKERCLCIDYTGDFHLDLVPVHSDGDLNQSLLIPPDWRETHPKGFISWCQERNTFSEYFKRIVRLLKYWRNIQWSKDKAPKSIILTTLIGNHLSNEGLSLDDNLVKSMEKLDKYLQKNETKPDVFNPSLTNEVLSEKWLDYQYQEFRDKFHSATIYAKEAIESDDELIAIKLWNSDVLFGGTFPKAERGLGKQAKDMADLMRNGKLGVSSSGILCPNSKANASDVKPTRFFGDIKD